MVFSEFKTNYNPNGGSSGSRTVQPAAVAVGVLGGGLSAAAVCNFNTVQMAMATVAAVVAAARRSQRLWRLGKPTRRCGGGGGVGRHTKQLKIFSNKQVLTNLNCREQHPVGIAPGSYHQNVPAGPVVCRLCRHDISVHEHTLARGDSWVLRPPDGAANRRNVRSTWLKISQCTCTFTVKAVQGFVNGVRADGMEKEWPPALFRRLASLDRFKPHNVGLQHQSPLQHTRTTRR